MALFAAADPQEEDGKLIAYPISAGARIWKGALVAINALGYLVAASDAQNNKFVGVAYESADATGQGSGKLIARVKKTGTYVVAKPGAAPADMGVAVYATADDTVANTSVNSVLVGYVTQVRGGQVRIRIDGVVH